jgi:hypothetical protein
MPAKPIKHGIKVFSLCCAATAVMLSFEVYCGKDNSKTDNTTVDICERLIHEADLVNNQTGGMIHGCIVYSNNYYTSVKMAKYLYVRPRIRKGPFSELALPVLVWVPVLEQTDFSIPVLELAPFLESPYVQAAISRTSMTNFIPFLVLASQF